MRYKYTLQNTREQPSAIYYCITNRTVLCKIRPSIPVTPNPKPWCMYNFNIESLEDESVKKLYEDVQ